MRRTINVFTSLIFIYSMIVCATCKQASPDKVGNLEFTSLTSNGSETVPLIQTKKKAASEDMQYSASTFITKED